MWMLKSRTHTRQFQKYWNGRPSLGAKDKAGRSNISEIDEYLGNLLDIS